MVMKKINNFWLVKSKSLRVQNVACYISLCYMVFLKYVEQIVTDYSMHQTTFHNFILWLILSTRWLPQTSEMVLNLSKQKLPSFQATTHYLLHNSKPVPFLGVLQWIEAALKDILRHLKNCMAICSGWCRRNYCMQIEGHSTISKLTSNSKCPTKDYVEYNQYEYRIQLVRVPFKISLKIYI